MAKRCWRHVVLNTKCSWLHGDRRGFRSRKHRIHSSGDYKNPPPPNEHEGLYRYHYSRSGDKIAFVEEVRIQLVQSFVLKIRSLGHRIIACSCGELHLHGLCELPDDYFLVKREVGKCKQRASFDVRQVLEGSIWSEGGQYKRITGKQHLHNSYRYIRAKQEAGTVVWSHREDENWIDDPEVGVIVIGPGHQQIRVFAQAQTRLGSAIE